MKKELLSMMFESYDILKGHAAIDEVFILTNLRSKIDDYLKSIGHKDATKNNPS